MYIREANVKNFGKLKNFQVTFSPGINVIYGENEAGKSTLQQFLLAMLFGMDKMRGRGSKTAPYEKYEPWDAPAYYAGSIRFSTGGQNFYLERNFYHKEKSAYLVNERDGEELSVEQGDLQMLLGGIAKEAYENTFFIRQDEVRPGTDLAACIQDQLHNLSETGDGSFPLTGALQYLQKERKKLDSEVKQLKVQQRHKLDLLQAEQKVLEENRQRLMQKYENQKKLLARQTPQKPVVQKGQNEPPASAEKHSFQPAVVLGIALSILLFFLRQRWEISLPLWLTAQIILLAVIVTGLLFAGRQKNEAEADAPEQSEPADPGLRELEKQQTVLRVIEEELQEKELELENNRNAQQELAAPEAMGELQEKEVQALLLAEETMTQLSTELGAGTAGNLDEAVSDIFSQITGGKYAQTDLTEKYEPQITMEYRKYRPQQFSTGTQQQLYFAARMAAGEFLEQEENLPFLLDEVFALYDDRRFMQVLRWMGEQKRQILLFTCQKREAECLKKLQIPFHMIHFEEKL